MSRAGNRHAAAIRHAIGELGLRRYAFVAHDSGGVVARLAAAGDPRVAGLVIGNSEISGYRPWQVELYAAVAKLPAGPALLGALLRLPFVRRSAIGYGGCFSSIDYLDGDFHELFVKSLLMDRRARRIGAPVRLVWGTLDPFFPSPARARCSVSSREART